MKRSWLLAAAFLVAAAPAAADTLSVEKALAEIQRNYFAPDLPGLDAQLREGAVRGMLRALNEAQGRHLGKTPSPPRPYWVDEGVNRLYTPDEFRLFRHDVTGKFGGVGMKLGPKDPAKRSGKPGAEPAPPPYAVLEAIAGMPAAKAGVKKEDVVVSVDGASVTTMPLQDLVLKLRGPAGSKLKVALERAGKPVQVELERQEIRLPSVTLTEKGGGTGVLHIRVFDGAASSELRAALETAVKDRLWGLVIDLRDCPGGQLDVCIEMCKMLLSKGQVFLRTRRRGEPEKTYTADGEPLWRGALVVLVSHHTASSGEILAGALKDNGKALVVGERTFGKATAEMVVELPEGYAMKVTSQVLYRPGGAETTASGVEPDVPLAGAGDRERTDDDDQVKAALRILGLAAPKGP